MRGAHFFRDDCHAAHEGSLRTCVFTTQRCHFALHTTTEHHWKKTLQLPTHIWRAQLGLLREVHHRRAWHDSLAQLWKVMAIYEPLQLLHRDTDASRLARRGEVESETNKR